MQKESFKTNSAFSLIELSIVIIAIALLITIVSQGAKLVEQSKLIKLTEEISSIKSSISQFTKLYQALPGDYTNASRLDNNCKSGNGNGVIDSTENNAFAHLYLADILLSKPLDSFAQISNDICNNGIYYPSNIFKKGKQKLAFYLKSLNSYNNGNHPYFTNSFGSKKLARSFIVLAKISKFRIDENDKILTSLQAKIIDDKIDDGSPNNGFVTALDDVGNNCVSGDSESIETHYKSSDGDQLTCRIIIRFK